MSHHTARWLKDNVQKPSAKVQVGEEKIYWLNLYLNYNRPFFFHVHVFSSFHLGISVPHENQKKGLSYFETVLFSKTMPEKYFNVFLKEKNNRKAKQKQTKQKQTKINQPVMCLTGDDSESIHPYTKAPLCQRAVYWNNLKEETN